MPPKYFQKWRSILIQFAQIVLFKNCEKSGENCTKICVKNVENILRNFEKKFVKKLVEIFWMKFGGLKWNIFSQKYLHDFPPIS